MEKCGYAESFRDLLAYQKARELARDIFEVSKQFPKEEMFASHLFCGQPNVLRESQPEYFTNNNPFTEHG